MTYSDHHPNLVRSKLSRWQIMALAGLLLALGSGVILHAWAQTSEEIWTTPTNISRSGTAVQPLIAAAPDGTLFALWWDAIDGTQFVRTTTVTGTTWTAPVNVPQIIGERIVNPQTGKVTLTPPRQVRLFAEGRTAQGALSTSLYALWKNGKDQLLSAHTQGAAWSDGVVLAESFTALDTSPDLTGTLHLVYIQPTDSAAGPAGLYYRSSTGRPEWSAPSPVYTSPYFRALGVEEAYLSVAGDGLGRRLVAWDDPRLGQSLYTYSDNGGRTWSAPQPVSSGQSQAAHTRVAATAQGEFLMLWQDSAGTNDCLLSQKRSLDGGKTWGAPERVLTNLSRCAKRWTVNTTSDGRLWLIGTDALNAPSSQNTSTVLAAWNGQMWAGPVNVSMSFREPALNRSVSLQCLQVVVMGKSASLAGCDAAGDVWAARSRLGLDQLLPSLKPVWSAPEKLTDPKSPSTVKDVPALTADGQGKLYALWSESPVEGAPGAAFNIAIWDGKKWSRAVEVLRPSNAADKAEQPALAADSMDRLHAVWSGGASGEIRYSSTYVRDATSAKGWGKPVNVPMPTKVGSSPDIVADPNNETLHVIYAVPFNEKRGIYYARSEDGGATWLTPTIIFDAVAAGWDGADKPRLALDARTNTLHAVWQRANLPGGSGPQAIVYAQSTDGGKTWNTPVTLAETLADSPRVAVPIAGQVAVAWSQSQGRATAASSTEVVSTFSLDGGARWNTSRRVAGFEGISGPVNLISDEAGSLYLVGLGHGTGGDSALLYSKWDGRTWNERQEFGLGQTAAAGNAAAAAFVPQGRWLGVVARASVAQSNGTQRFEVLATGRTVEVSIAITPAPTWTPLPTATATTTATPRPTATVKPQLAPTPIANATRNQTSRVNVPPLILSGILAAIIAIGVVVIRIVVIARR